MLVTVAVVSAFTVAAAAAVADWHTGRIANWITLPVAFGSPLVYAFLWSPERGVISAVSLVLCGLVPYLLFRNDAMGGGDVKLFAALGATTGFDLRLGLEIELVALLVATAGAFVVLVRRRRLLQTLTHAVAPFRRLLRVSRPDTSSPSELLTPVRLGLPVFVGTTVVLFPVLFEQWTAR